VGESVMEPIYDNVLYPICLCPIKSVNGHKKLPALARLGILERAGEIFAAAGIIFEAGRSWKSKRLRLAGPVGHRRNAMIAAAGTMGMCIDRNSAWG
jgi:hypothetical protein